MGIGLDVKALLQGERWKFVLSGGLLGVYFNVSHSVVFMEASDFFVVAFLTVFFAGAVCVFGAVWGSKDLKPDAKACSVLFGATWASAFFASIYFLEFFVSAYFGDGLSNLLHFPVSRVPFVSFIVSSVIAVLLGLLQLLLKRKLGYLAGGE